MDIEIGSVMDFAGSLGVLGMLAVAYGSIRRRFAVAEHAQTVLGILFGIVAVAQMHAPIEPFEGFLMDLRNVPIVLAGAFLGVRGSVACLLLAATARLQIGGIGMAGGIVAMLISGAVGAAWSIATQGRRRGPMALLALGALTCLNFVAVVMLPPALAIFYLTQVAPPLAVLYVVAVPLVGGLLQREIDRNAQEGRLRDAAEFGEDGLMPAPALAWAMVHSATVGSLQGPVDCVMIRLRHHGVLARLWGGDVPPAARAALGARLLPLLAPEALVGWAGPETILITLPEGIIPGGPDALVREIRDRLEDEPIDVPGAGAVRLRLDVETWSYAALPPLAEIVTGMQDDARPGDLADRRAPAAAPARGARSARGSRPVTTSPHDLFATFERLRAARPGSS